MSDQIPPSVALARDAIIARWSLNRTFERAWEVRDLINIYEGLHGLFGNSPETERDWLDEPRDTLAGETPRQWIESGLLGSVRQMVWRLCQR